MPEGKAFVNIGVWHGFSLLCGMVNNLEKTCIGVDNFAMPGNYRESFLRRFAEYRSHRHRFYGMDYIEYFSGIHKEPIGFYMYDAGHTYDDQRIGLEVAEPFFAKDCIILVDDTNWDAPRNATLDFVAHSNNDYRILMDKQTRHNCHPTLWNGLMVLRKTS